MFRQAIYSSFTFWLIPSKNFKIITQRQQFKSISQRIINFIEEIYQHYLLSLLLKEGSSKMQVVEADCPQINVILQQNIQQRSNMYRQNNSTSIITFQNEECNCFGTSTTSQEQFLAKQNILDSTPNPYNNNPKTINPDASFFKNSFKKSLKRQLVPMLSPTPLQTPPKEKFNYPKSPNPSEKHRDLREFMSPQCKPAHSNFKTSLMPAGTISPLNTVAMPQRQVISCKIIKKAVTPLNTGIPLLSPSSMGFRSPSKPVTISYYTSQYGFTSPSKRYFEPTSSPSSPVIARTDYSPTPTSLTFNYSEQNDEMDASESTKIISKLHVEAPQKGETTSSLLKSAQLKSAVNSSTYNSSSNQQEANTKSQEEACSYLQVNSLRGQKKALTRMSDVEEIHSQLDQDEISNSEKESVVLGRLNQYGSMIDPTLSHVSSASSGVLVRFNSGVELGRLLDRPFMAY